MNKNNVDQTYTYHFTHPTKKGSHPKKAYIRYYEPLKLYVIYATYTDYLDNNIQKSTLLLSGIALALLLIIAIPMYLIANNIAKYIVSVSTQAKELSEGDGDLTKRLEAHSKDELGILGSYMNKFLQLVQNIISNINISANKVHQLTQDVQDTIGAMRSNSNKVKSLLDQTSDRSIEATNAINEINIGTKEIAVSIGNMINVVKELEIVDEDLTIEVKKFKV
jgi:methyl-accepting chemotaxis protein